MRASIPEQGRLLTFKRAVAVERLADLKIDLQTAAVRAASWGVRAVIVVGTLFFCGLLAWLGRLFGQTTRETP